MKDGNGYEERVKKVLEKSATAAAKLITSAITNEELPFKQRYDAANEVLIRLFGKAASEKGTDRDQQQQRVEIIFKGDAERYAK